MAGVRETAFMLLKAVYESSHGDCQELISSEDAARRLGIVQPTARGALGYLIDRGLVRDSREMAALPHVFITGSGVDAVEDALARPGIPTQHFPAVQNIINIGTFNGGAIQQGTSRSTQVTGHAGSLSGMDLTKLAVEFASLRAAVLPQASSPEHFSAIGRLSEAQIGAEANDASKVQQALSSLGQAGRWLLSTSEKIGVGLATAALKTHLNL
jgi:hypothetical protein